MKLFIKCILSQKIKNKEKTIKLQTYYKPAERGKKYVKVFGGD